MYTAKVRIMKNLTGAIAAVAVLIGAAVSGPAAAATPAAISTAKTAAAEALPADIKLSSTQLSNFVIAYCLNVAAHGPATTRTLFLEVVQQDQISDTQATYIEDVAAATCG